MDVEYMLQSNLLADLGISSPRVPCSIFMMNISALPRIVS
jgi:hypothetical protein